VVWVAGLFILSQARVRASVEFAFPAGGWLPTGQVGVAYPPFQLIRSWAGDTVIVTSSPLLPLGMVVNNKGVLSGTPLEPFSNCPTFSATDADNTYQGGLCLLIKPIDINIVSTGKKVNDKGTITRVSDNYLVVDNKIIIRLTDDVRIQLKKAAAFTVGQEIHYKGVLNTDGSVTATEFVQVKN
jgi:hypothetical protein